MTSSCVRRDWLRQRHLVRDEVATRFVLACTGSSSVWRLALAASRHQRAITPQHVGRCSGRLARTVQPRVSSSSSPPLPLPQPMHRLTFRLACIVSVFGGTGTKPTRCIANCYPLAWFALRSWLCLMVMVRAVF